MVILLKFVLLCVINVYIIGSNGRKYCNSSICNNNKELCKFQQTETTARRCLDLVRLVQTDEDKKALLDKINSRRNKVAAGELRSYPAAANMMKLEWNSKLEQTARRWANQCVRANSPDIKDACRDMEGVRVGQNIASIYGESPGLQATALVDVWYMELLNNNGSILTRFHESRENGPKYEYFTQLVWADTTEVGCGGVKFKERLQDEDSNRNRTVYRLVCNFAPSGNHDNETVYAQGVPCSGCPNGTSCDSIYNALCSKPAYKIQENQINNTSEESHQQRSEVISTEKYYGEEVKNTTISDNESDFENNTLFDYFSHLHEFTRQAITLTSTPKPECKDVLAVDDFIDLLRKRLSNDQLFKELLLATKTTQAFPDTNFTDTHVAAFVNKIYSKKIPSTTTKSRENELLNSTLLADLVEAVIFRSGDNTPASNVVELSTNSIGDINPVKIQAQLAQIPDNEAFTGHYFFPQDDEDSNITETTESYYDGTNLSIYDIILEIEDIKRSTVTKNFLDDILESESSEPTDTTVTTTFLLPDTYKNARKSGHEVMKKFLGDIKEKSGE